MKTGDPALPLHFCIELVTKITNDPGFLNKLIVSDEAIFSLNSEVNTRNVVKYSAFGYGHPDDHYVEFEQGLGKIMVWMGLTREGTMANMLSAID